MFDAEAGRRAKDAEDKDEFRKIASMDTEEVVTMLRELSQGEGLNEHDLNIWLYDHKVDYDGSPALMDRIITASELVTNKEHRQAIRNALAIEGQGKNLTERRMGYLTNVDISYRTLVRHETEGAQAIAEILPKVSDGPGGSTALIMERLDDIESMLLLLTAQGEGIHRYSRIRIDSEYLDASYMFTAIERSIERYKSRVKGLNSVTEATESQ